jgi:hypothetical protein
LLRFFEERILQIITDGDDCGFDDGATAQTRSGVRDEAGHKRRWPAPRGWFGMSSYFYPYREEALSLVEADRLDPGLDGQKANAGLAICSIWIIGIAPSGRGSVEFL